MCSRAKTNKGERGIIWKNTQIVYTNLVSDKEKNTLNACSSQPFTHTNLMLHNDQTQYSPCKKKKKRKKLEPQTSCTHTHARTSFTMQIMHTPHTQSPESHRVCPPSACPCETLENSRRRAMLGLKTAPLPKAPQASKVASQERYSLSCSS